MSSDNTTPLAAADFDREVTNVIPYYPEFYAQTLDVAEAWNRTPEEWLDLGGGTGSLEALAFTRFPDVRFTLLDPSEGMLAAAREKLKGRPVDFLCAGSASIAFEDRFDVITAIQAHHYLREGERKEATARIYRALKTDGIYICFENTVPQDETACGLEFQRWDAYKVAHGMTEAEAKAHSARRGVHIFPITVPEHIRLLNDAGFRGVHVFWRSYMQMGIYAIK